MAKTQAYAVLYNRKGLFLIAKKLEKGYYFSENQAVIPDGQKLNGAGKFALPGGGQKTNEAIDAAGAREFHEETGVDLPTSTVSTHSFKDGKYKWNAAYFCVESDQDVQNTCNEIELNSLKNSAAIVKEIQEKKIKTYSELIAYAKKNNLTPYPSDNELAHVECWNLNDPQTWGNIQTWRLDTDVNWYYFILQYLHDGILKIS